MRGALLWLVCALLVVVTRLPLAPGQLFSFDEVNFAYAMGEFDIRLSQPHPPGYPLFVLETRILSRLRFIRPESNFLTAGVLAGASALALAVWAGNRILGGSSGWWAAFLLFLNHAFWHGGLTSAVRVHLAAVSLGVAGLCWLAWRGERRFVYASAAALGLGAGFRPELGVLLFPLWAAGLARGRIPWRERWLALAVLAGTGLAWFLPAALASGGVAAYVSVCRQYIAGQAGATSALFGASHLRYWSVVCWLAVWTLSGTLAWPLTAALAWSRGEGWGLSRERWAFLALWFLPQFFFALFVHIEDAAQSLAMVPVVCLAGGYLVERGAARLAAFESRLTLPLLASLPGLLYLIDRTAGTPAAVAALPGLALAVGLALRRTGGSGRARTSRVEAAVALLVPALMLQTALFMHRSWYFPAARTPGWRGALERRWSDVHAALSLGSYGHVRSVTSFDDRALRALRLLARNHPGQTFVLWENGICGWRKTAYYFPALPVVVLENPSFIPDSPTVTTLWNGSREVWRTEGDAALNIEVPSGARLVWFVKPASAFERALREAFRLSHEGPLHFVDLPREDGGAAIGRYRVSWRL